MENQEIFNRLSAVKKGRYIAIQKQKFLEHGIVKVSNLIIRLGIRFANMAINEGRQTGHLPWGHWVDGYENLVIEHKGKYYLRVASSYSHNNKVAYYRDGQEISEATAIVLLGEKKVISDEKDIYNIKFENIIAIDVR